MSRLEAKRQAVSRVPYMLFLERGHPVRIVSGRHQGERGVILGRTQSLDPEYRVLLTGGQRGLWFGRDEILYARPIRRTPGYR